jgi:endonuclease III
MHAGRCGESGIAVPSGAAGQHGEADLAAVIGQRGALHPFARSMGRYVTGTCRLLCDEYDGRAPALWDDMPAATVLAGRLTAFPGIGTHKADVVLFLLTRQY